MNPQFLQLVSPNETVVVISLNVKIGGTNGMINICIPHVVLEPIFPKFLFIIGCRGKRNKKPPGKMEGLKKKIMNVKVPVSAELGPHGNYRERFSYVRRWRCD